MPWCRISLKLSRNIIYFCLGVRVMVLVSEGEFILKRDEMLKRMSRTGNIVGPPNDCHSWCSHLLRHRSVGIICKQLVPKWFSVHLECVISQCKVKFKKYCLKLYKWNHFSSSQDKFFPFSLLLAFTNVIYPSVHKFLVRLY